MARNSFNFQTNIGINTKVFKKGVRDVQKSIQSLWGTFKTFSASLGAGLGFGVFVSKMSDTVKELSVAEATLNNVSKTTREYGDNLKWLQGLSKSLAQDYIKLTNNFAQFHAACENTTLSLEKQKSIYESLTQASTFYHMSAERTADMMNAITQMMSKGKVTAEELRRQLGNALPGAFNIMAASMGLTTAQMDDMMKKGKIISEEALPRFAAMLKQMTSNIDLNSVQLQLNQLSNAWTNLVRSSNVEGAYSKLLKSVTKLLDKIANNFTKFKQGLVSALMFFASMNVFKKISAQADVFYDRLKERNKELKAQNKEISKEIDKVGRKYKVTFKDVQKGGYTIPQTYTNKQGKQVQVPVEDYSKLVALSKQYSNNLAESDKNIINMNKDLTTFGGAFTKLFRGIKGSLLTIGNMLKMNIYAMLAGAILGAITKIVTSVIDWKKEQERISNIYKDQMAEYDRVSKATDGTEKSLRNELSVLKDQNSTLASKVRALRTINETLGLVGKNQFTIKSNYQDINKEVGKWIENMKKANQVQHLIGQWGENDAKIKELDKKLDNLSEEYFKKTGWRLFGYIKRNGEGLNSRYNLDTAPDKSWIKKNVMPVINELNQLRKTNEVLDAEMKRMGAEMADYTDNEPKAFRDLEDNTERTKADIQSYLDMFENIDQRHTEIANRWLRDLQEAEQSAIKSKDPLVKLANERRALQSKLNAGTITSDVYNKELARAIEKAIDEKLTGDKDYRNENFLATETGRKLTAELQGLQTAIKGAWMDKTKEIFEEYEKSRISLADQKVAFDKTDEWYSGQLRELDEDLVKSLLQFGNLDEMLNRLKETFPEFASVLEKTVQNIKNTRNEFYKDAIGDIDVPVKPERDDFFDYKKNQKDVAKENLKDAKDFYKEVVKYYSELEKLRNSKEGIGAIKQEDLDSLIQRIKEIAELSKNEDILDVVKYNTIENLEDAKDVLDELADSFEDLEQAARVAELKVDIETFSKEVTKATYSSIKDLATSADRLQSALESFMDAFDIDIDDETKEAWKKVTSVFNLITQTIDSIGSVMQGFEQLSELTDKLKRAEDKLNSIEQPSKVIELSQDELIAIKEKEIAILEQRRKDFQESITSQIREQNLALLDQIAKLQAIEKFSNRPKYKVSTEPFNIDGNETLESCVVYSDEKKKSTFFEDLFDKIKDKLTPVKNDTDDLTKSVKNLNDELDNTNEKTNVFTKIGNWFKGLFGKKETATDEIAAETAAIALNSAAKIGNTEATALSSIADKEKESSAEGVAVANAVEAGSDLVAAAAAKEDAKAQSADAAAKVAKVTAGNIFAGIATAAAVASAVAGIVSILKSAGAFANGGIVGGSSMSGDKLTAQVNSGEMILNKQQQSTLWGMLNGKPGGSAGEVNFRIKGQDLVGTLNNYSKQRKG